MWIWTCVAGSLISVLCHFNGSAWSTLILSLVMPKTFFPEKCVRFVLQAVRYGCHAKNFFFSLCVLWLGPGGGNLFFFGKNFCVNESQKIDHQKFLIRLTIGRRNIIFVSNIFFCLSSLYESNTQAVFLCVVKMNKRNSTKRTTVSALFNKRIEFPSHNYNIRTITWFHLLI